MFRFLLASALALSFKWCAAQKQPIDSSTYGKWPSVNSPKISNDGRYTAYTIDNQPVNNHTTIVSSVDKSWQLTLPGATKCEFSQDSRRFFFITHDSLGLGDLRDSAIHYVSGVTSYRLAKRSNDKDWLIYQKKTSPNELIVRDVVTGKETKYFPVNSFWLVNHNEDLLLASKVQNDDKTTGNLESVNLATGKKQLFWKGVIFGRLVIDRDGQHASFLGSENGLQKETAIWCLQFDSLNAFKLADAHSVGMHQNSIITNIEAFDKNNLFFRWQSTDSPAKGTAFPGVNVWSYKDPTLQSRQLLDAEHNSQYIASINLQTRRILLLEDKSTEIISQLPSPASYVLVQKTKYGSVGHEWNWNPYGKSSTILVSLIDGKTRSISKSLEETRIPHYVCQFSPNGKYVIYYDPVVKNYFSYTISTGRLQNITGSIHTTWTTIERDDEPSAGIFPIGTAGFAREDSSVLLYDQHDIFQVDLENKMPPCALTNRYGQKHNIIFRLATHQRNNLVNVHERLILNAFSFQTKDDGFYTTIVGKQKNPTLLSMQSFIMDGPDEGNVNLFEPIKARDSDIYIVRKMSAAESPNYYLTRDFRKFIRFTDVHPESNYVWIASQLITFRTIDGKATQGILYKPENFDSTKKYPLIITYYEKVSSSLNAFIEPAASCGPIEIPLYVSNGYLVFTPDIHFTIGRPGQSSYNTVVAAAKYLASKPYVKATKIGIQGHSFGGFQTDYIITHSHLFAAAMSSAGMSDFVSAYGSIIRGGDSRQRQYELYRDRMGATLWQIPNSYLDNSPVMRADKASTPLLMMANKEDADVPYSQGTEFFTALRRLGKKVWMLQYDGEGHLLSDKSSSDFTIRMFQFFNHYLKDFPPPRWMTEGIPASLKGIDSGLALDASNKQP
jgi:dienelactone hydrolase